MQEQKEMPINLKINLVLYLVILALLFCSYFMDIVSKSEVILILLSSKIAVEEKEIQLQSLKSKFQLEIPMSYIFNQIHRTGQYEYQRV